MEYIGTNSVHLTKQMIIYVTPCELNIDLNLLLFRWNLVSTFYLR